MAVAINNRSAFLRDAATLNPRSSRAGPEVQHPRAAKATPIALSPIQTFDVPIAPLAVDVGLVGLPELDTVTRTPEGGTEAVDLLDRQLGDGVWALRIVTRGKLVAPVGLRIRGLAPRGATDATFEIGDAGAIYGRRYVVFIEPAGAGLRSLGEAGREPGTETDLGDQVLGSHGTWRLIVLDGAVRPVWAGMGPLPRIGAAR